MLQFGGLKLCNTIRVEFEKSYGNAFMKLAGSISHRDNHGELKHCWDTLLAGCLINF
jgi:hypothetical protein